MARIVQLTVTLKMEGLIALHRETKYAWETLVEIATHVNLTFMEMTAKHFVLKSHNNAIAVLTGPSLASRILLELNVKSVKKVGRVENATSVKTVVKEIQTK